MRTLLVPIDVLKVYGDSGAGRLDESFQLGSWQKILVSPVGAHVVYSCRLLRVPSSAFNPSSLGLMKNKVATWKAREQHPNVARAL